MISSILASGTNQPSTGAMKFETAGTNRTFLSAGITVTLWQPVNITIKPLVKRLFVMIPDNLCVSLPSFFILALRVVLLFDPSLNQPEYEL